MRVYDIKWDIKAVDVYEHLDSMSAFAAAASLGISFEEYERMSLQERYDYAYYLDYSKKLKFLGLPTEVEVPTHLTDVDDIADWLSEEYGKVPERYSPFEVAEFILSRD